MKLDGEAINQRMGTQFSKEEMCAIESWEKHRNDIMSKMQDWPDGEPVRWKLPDERRSLTHHFEIGDQEDDGISGYITCGMYDNYRLGEVFIVINKQGSFVSGMTDAMATALSIALQHGIPLSTFTSKFAYTRFEPGGPVKGAPQQELKMASSVLDYISRWLLYKFPDGSLSMESRCPCGEY